MINGGYPETPDSWIERREEDEYSNEPVVDDSIRCCPECETPNQFGELCHRCLNEQSHM